MPEYLAPGVYVEELPSNNVKASFEDVSLPALELTKLESFYEYIQQTKRLNNNWQGIHANGVAALFSGSSGTGKTMAAQVLANRLGMDIFKIDLSQTINKYIGETEKNLGMMFKQAGSSGAILFFDEADALFGKRTEVSDSHDRYANIEVNYLLQRIELFKGVVILATNSMENIDNAFTRRLYTVIDFPLPKPPRRRNVWSRLWRWIKYEL